MALAIEEGTDYRQLVVEHDALFSLLDQDGRGSNLRPLGRSAFYASTVDGREKRAWMARNPPSARRPSGRTGPELLTLLTMH